MLPLTSSRQSSQWKARVRRGLLAWYARHKRPLPWRKRKSLYAIWVSEIMLQQTQVSTVIDYYRRFIQRFPSLRALAAADQADVLWCWEGLGYYRRARDLHAAAKLIVERHGGRFPNRFDELIKLPGIGRYTAGAILSIALDQRLPILETNSVRLLSRLTALDLDVASPEGQRKLWSTAEELLPQQQCGDFNQAMMELGATVCLPQPRCHECPLRRQCRGHALGIQLQLPIKKSAAKRVTVVRQALIIAQHQDSVLLRYCTEDRWWAGMWDFPRLSHPLPSVASSLKPPAGRNGSTMAGPCEEEECLREHLHRRWGVRAARLMPYQKLRHTVTRFRIEVDCYTATGVRKRLPARDGSWQWVPIGQLDRWALPAPSRRLAQTLTNSSL